MTEAWSAWPSKSGRLVFAHGGGSWRPGVLYLVGFSEINTFKLFIIIYE